VGNSYPEHLRCWVRYPAIHYLQGMRHRDVKPIQSINQSIKGCVYISAQYEAQHAETVRRPFNSLNSEHLHPSAVTKTSRLLKMPPNSKLDEGRTFRRRYVGAFLILLTSILIGMSPSFIAHGPRLLLTPLQV
jgi:hypothetical protein